MQNVDVRGAALSEEDLGSYLEMRLRAPKPPAEERHAKHIQRFYACRGLRRSGYQELYVLPEVAADGEAFHPDVAGRRGEGLIFVYCAAHSLDEIPRSEIRALTGNAGPMLMLVVANVLDVDVLQQEFADLVGSGRLSIRTMTLPPFDDVLEYDIWMFELTFQEAAR
jgi:hypothetical protein